jgi:hypothetical protein
LLATLLATLPEPDRFRFAAALPPPMVPPELAEVPGAHAVRVYCFADLPPGAAWPEGVALIGRLASGVLLGQPWCGHPDAPDAPAVYRAWPSGVRSEAILVETLAVIEIARDPNPAALADAAVTTDRTGWQPASPRGYQRPVVLLDVVVSAADSRRLEALVAPAAAEWAAHTSAA